MICEWERPGTMWYPALLGEETVSKALTSMNWNNFEFRTRLFVVACILWHCFRSRGRSRRLARIYDLACLSSELASYILFNCFHTTIRIKIEFTSYSHSEAREGKKSLEPKKVLSEDLQLLLHETLRNKTYSAIEICSSEISKAGFTFLSAEQSTLTADDLVSQQLSIHVETGKKFFK